MVTGSSIKMFRFIRDRILEAFRKGEKDQGDGEYQAHYQSGNTRYIIIYFYFLHDYLFPP